MADVLPDGTCAAGHHDDLRSMARVRRTPPRPAVAGLRPWGAVPGHGEGCTEYDNLLPERRAADALLRQSKHASQQRQPHDGLCAEHAVQRAPHGRRRCAADVDDGRPSAGAAAAAAVGAAGPAEPRSGAADGPANFILAPIGACGLWCCRPRGRAAAADRVGIREAPRTRWDAHAAAAHGRLQRLQRGHRGPTQRRHARLLRGLRRL
mmetsp:Transcript_40038/g.118728  ORF Transcript_40038/g.118728 Transcript_40038/m.118728 type:complete len:208 (+) Transcript_40038:830-1453(+)